MTTSEDSDLLTYINSTLSTENNCNGQLPTFNYFPSVICSLNLPKKKPSVISISNNLLYYEEKNRLHLPVDENYFKIVIQDNGIRFEKEYADRIFQIFQRLHGKSEYPGSGIGLAICKEIAKNHKGIIDAESTPEIGVTFTITYLKDKFQRKHELS